MKSLTDKELLNVLRYGIVTQLEGYDDKKTHYAVIDFCDVTDELLICFGGISWKDGQTSYTPHRIKASGKNKTWFFANPNNFDIV